MVTAEEGAAVLSTPTKDSNNNTVTPVGRYAFAIYDEGGLLDVNVAGYPTLTSIFQYGRKGSLAFTDLTALPYPIPNPDGNSIYKVDKIIGWRNYATTQPTNTYPGTTPQPFAKNFQTDATPATNYYNSVLANTNGFLRLDQAATPFNARTDQAFVSRQELIEYAKSGGNLGGFTVNALQYLGTFSREGLVGAPQWSPVFPDSINPNFQKLWVTGSFTRNDGTTASVGDPLVSKRFLLQRLNWLTYKGPSATRNLSDPDMSILTSRFGLTSAFLQLGTAVNIQKYFGLSWDSTNERWNYVGSSGSTIKNSISTFGPGGTQSATREPDFFELLQAGILSNSLGDSSSPDTTLLPVTHQQSTMLHVLSIGANLIAQARTDSYPVRIACSVGGATMEAVGASRLPYLGSLAIGPVAGTGASGGVNWFLVPNIWDPFRDSWDLTEANVSSTLTPNYLRPPVRITVGSTAIPGTVGFGSVLASGSTSGIIPSASATPFPTTVSGINASLTLKTGATTGNAFGRDGHLEAARLSASDFASPPASYTVTTSPTSAGSGWCSITRPPRPDGTMEGTTNLVAFRLSLPGSGIPSSATTTSSNPVLILKPGFQVTIDYQSPNGNWYSYSLLQGNNATSTWISAGNPSNPSLNVAMVASTYGYNPGPPVGTAPTVLKAGAATPWDMVTLAQAPMFAKADPRSIRYNSQVGVINVASPPMAVVSAGIIGSIWPNGYATPPPMILGPNPTPSPSPTPPPTPTPSPTPTPTPSATPNPPNPATLGDNSLAGTTANPYNESTGATWRPIIMNRPFRSVGEMGYAFRDQSFKTLDFSSPTSPDAGLLDLFSTNDYAAPSGMRAGVVNLNTAQSSITAAVLTNTIRREDTPRVNGGSPSAPSPSPSPLTVAPATNTAVSLALQTASSPVVNKAALTQLVANETGLGATVTKTQRESIVRALSEVAQTRTWNLMIDVIAQSGRYPPTATAAADLPKFIVEGEQRYWVHVAIDRFTGQIIDQQVEIVKE